MMIYLPEDDQPDYTQPQSNINSRLLILGVVGALIVVCVCVLIAAGIGWMVLPAAFRTDRVEPTSLAAEVPTLAPPSGTLPTLTAPTVEEVPVLSAAHVSDGELDPSILSNPPTGGPHYSRAAPAGFYNFAADPGFLLHSMEHGYVIVWYNCDRLPDDQNCETLESQVKNLVENNGDKLIGVVYESLNVPVAISSWKHKLELDGFDSDLLVDFIVTYRLVDAPEPNAP